MTIHVFINESYYKEVATDIEPATIVLALREYTNFELKLWRGHMVEMFPSNDDEYREFKNFCKSNLTRFGTVAIIKNPSRVHLELANYKAKQNDNR